MSPGDRARFYEWYDRLRVNDYVFDFEEEILKYCRSDVNILQRDKHSGYGGRTNAAKLFHQSQQDEEIHFVDFTSLYPRGPTNTVRIPLATLRSSPRTLAISHSISVWLNVPFFLHVNFSILFSHIVLMVSLCFHCVKLVLMA